LFFVFLAEALKKNTVCPVVKKRSRQIAKCGFLFEQSYVRYISRKHENFRYWPYKTHDVTIETPTNHISSRQDIVIRSVENEVGIVR
jgi:hypothetical protein